MNMKMGQEKNKKFEAFKSDLLKWKNEHRECIMSLPAT